MSDPVRGLMIDRLADAHAVEQFMAKALDSLISASPDFPELQRPLREHREATARHLDRLAERLTAAGTGTPTLKDTALTVAALGKSLVDKARTDNAGNTARDGYVAVHLVIATYEILKRLAVRTDDREVIAVVDQHLADERAMADTLDHSWDLAVDLSLKAHGLDGAPAIPPPSSMTERARQAD